ncbi:hypothetical protein SO694_000011138 [Aureococcus anophagefferens]|uniref:S1 motif domain-containing protein n=1 Tax=Aureococcus anophagefferens TaxID=44056 RepID=A0ABR1GC45_AURAN
MAALFPRGSLPDTPQDDKKKEKKRKVVADEVLFGTHKSKGDEAPQKKSKETEALDMISQGAVKAGSKGRPAKLVKVQFASYHSEMSALGVVRSASAKNALVSLPGNLVGHVDLVSGDSAGLTLKAGAVVRCARGVRLEDLAKGRVAALCGAVTSAEARGYVVDVGVAGATGFLKRGDCDGELAAGALVECRVLKVDAESGVVALARDGAVADAANGGNAKKWTLQALCVGQRVAATVARKLPNGVTVTFCEGMLAGCVDRDHLDGLLGDDAYAADDRFAPGSRLECRVLLVDRSAKVVRLTCVPHLVSLGGAAVDGGELALPAVGSFARRAVVRRVDPRVGAVLAFDHGDTEIGAFVHVSRWPGAAEKKAKKKKAGDGDDGSSDDDEDRLEVGAEVDCRVVGAAPLEGWALCSMVKQSMDPEVPLGKDELEAGALLKATVLAVKSWGVEARLSETLTGSLTNMHVAESGGVDPRKHAKKGDVIDVRVLRVEARRVELTAKRSLVKDAGAKLASYADAKQRVGGSFVGFVTGADATRGLTVTFYANVHGRVSPESLRARGVSDAAEAFPLGTCVTVAVRGVVAKTRADGTSKPRLLLALSDDDAASSAAAAADVAPGQRFDAARVTELVVTKPRKNARGGGRGGARGDGGRGPLPRRAPGGSSFLAKLPAALACDHGALAGDVLRRLGAGDKPTFPCVVVEGPGGGAVAKIASAPAILAAASGGDFPTAAEDLALNTIYVGAVTAVKPYGAFVAFGGGLRGLVPRSLVADKFIASVEECFAVGDVVRCCVDKIEDDGKILLRTRGVPRDGAGAFGASLFEAAAAIVDAGAPPFYAGVALGASYDALVEAVDADGRVACNVDGTPCLAPAAHALACAKGDVVKVRCLSVDGRAKRVLCSMLPEVVKPGRGKKRKEGLKALAAGAAVDAADALDAQAFPPPGAGAALALDRATGALVIASVGDFHRRGEAVPAAVEGFVVARPGAAEPRFGGSPFGHLAVVHAAVDAHAEDQPRHRRGSIAVDPDAGDEERARRPAGKKHLPATDVAALEFGDAVHGRVIKVSAEAIALSVRVEGGEDARVRCQLHASDCFVASVARVSDAPEAMTEPSSTLGAAHPFHDVRQGAVLHCVLLAKRQDKGLTLLDLGLGKKCARKGRGADDVAAYLAQAGASGACLPAGDADAQLGELDAAFSLPGSVDGVCAATELADAGAWSDRPRGPAPGAVVRCVVLEMVKGTAHVSLRPSRLARASTAPDAKPKVGDVRPGFVVGADKKAGVFVELARNVVGRVLLKDLADSYVADVPGTFPVGRLVAPVVTRVADDGKLDLSLRPSAIDKEGAVVASIDVGDVLTGLVTRVEAYGVFVKLDDAPRDAASGLAHKSQLSDDFVKDVNTLFAKGDRVKAKVLKIDEPAEPGGRRKLSLGLKPSYFDGDDAAMADASDDDDSDGDDDALARADALLADDSDDDDDAMEEDDDEEEDSDEEEGDDVGGLVEDEAEESGDDGSGDDESDDDLDDDDEEDEEEEAGALRWEEDAPAAPSRKKAKKAEQSEAALDDEADAAESALLADADPRTAEDYERLLVTEWNAAATWIAYAKLLVRESDATGARGVLERALKKIGYREEAQRLEAWAALLAHERDHGDAKSLGAAVDRATKNADPTRVLLKLAALHEETSNYDAADAAYARAEKRSRRQGATPDDVWLAHCRSRLLAGAADDARAVLDRAVQACADGGPKAEASLLAKFACLELDVGSADRGRTLFDTTLAKWPKRADLWQLYVAKSLKAGDVAHARAIQMRLAGVNLPPKAMRQALKRFAAFEEAHGDAASADAVKDLARAYVQKQQAAMDEDD